MADDWFHAICCVDDWCNIPVESTRVRLIFHVKWLALLSFNPQGLKSFSVVDVLLTRARLDELEGVS